MDIKTVFGVIWRKATYFDVLLIVLLVLCVVAFFIYLKYLDVKKNKKINDHQLFLYKLRRLGLTNFQIKIIINFVDLLKLSNPNLLLMQPAFFEKAIGKFLIFLKTANEQEESLKEICKDITITYGKLFHPATFKKPLESISDVDIDQLIYFVTDDETVFIGKVAGKSGNSLSIKLFRQPKNLRQLEDSREITVYIWRLGDAEYVFETKTLSLNINVLMIEIPEKFERDHAFRLPYYEVIVPISIVKATSDPDEEKARIEGTLFKLNDYEAVVRLSSRLDFAPQYFLHFELIGFQFKILVKIISDRSIEENNVYFDTLKFEGMSEAARHILKKYLYEHL